MRLFFEDRTYFSQCAGNGGLGEDGPRLLLPYLSERLHGPVALRANECFKFRESRHGDFLGSPRTLLGLKVEEASLFRGDSFDAGEGDGKSLCDGRLAGVRVEGIRDALSQVEGEGFHVCQDTVPSTFLPMTITTGLTAPYCRFVP
jgi:hypothetical protein